MDEMETVIATYSFFFYIDPHIPFLYQSIMLKIAMHKVKKHQLNYNMASNNCPSGFYENDVGTYVTYAKASWSKWKRVNCSETFQSYKALLNTKVNFTYTRK
jgi:hypothetical protein